MVNFIAGRTQKAHLQLTHPVTNGLDITIRLSSRQCPCPGRGGKVAFRLLWGYSCSGNVMYNN